MFSRVFKLDSTKKLNYNVFFCNMNLHSTSLCLMDDNIRVENKRLNKINDILGKYDKEKEEKILKLINNCSLNDLLSYEISKSRANKLLAWRVSNGLLKNVNDLFRVEGFGPKVTHKFVQSLLLKPKTSELNLGKGRVITAPFVAPSVETDQRQAIKSSVSVRVGVNSITWARLDIPDQDTNTPCLLTHWEHHEISEKKLHLSELIQRCLYVNHLIPHADCYLFENPRMAQTSNNPGSVEQQNINIQKAQVIAIMSYALASRNYHINVANNELNKRPKHLPNLFYVRRFLSARLFNHLVGTERVSSEQTVLNMMRTFYNTNEMQDFLPPQNPADDEFQKNSNNVNFSCCVQFPMELRNMFSKAPPYYREFLSQVLLLNLAFVRLVLMQDAKSIAAVSRGNKSKSALNNET